MARLLSRNGSAKTDAAQADAAGKFDPNKFEAGEFLSAFVGEQRDLPLPAALAIVVDDTSMRLSVQSIMRLLPGKRVVFRAALDNRLVAVKLFVKSRTSARHIQRERAGYERVRAAGVLCPKLIGQCLSECGRFEGLIYEFISDATELAQSWPLLSERQKDHRLQQVVTATLQLHQRAGAYQEDIHLGNFLIKDDQLYLLDLGSIVVRSAPLPQAQCLANLGQLIAQFDVFEQERLNAPIERYLVQCGWRDSVALQDALQSAVRSAWRRRLRDYLGKTRRDCSLTVFEKTADRVFAFRRAWQGDDLEKFARDPDAFMAAAELLKAGNTATVVKARFGAEMVVIKRYNIKNWRHALSRALRPTRAEHSWRFAHLLELAGIASLEPIALLERRRGPLRSTAYFVSSYIEAPDLLSVGAQRALNDDELASLQALLTTLCICRLSHGDFKANNLLIANNCIALIDLDAMARHHAADTFRRAFDKDMQRLLANWSDTNSLHRQIIDMRAALLDKLPSLRHL